MKLAEALDDRASSRRFCGFSSTKATPERRPWFVTVSADRHGLDRRLFEAVTAQLKSKAITVKTGTLVDATIARPATRMRWALGQASEPAPVHGFKAHVGADVATSLVERVSHARQHS